MTGTHAPPRCAALPNYSRATSSLTATHLVFAWLLQQLDGEPLPTIVLAQLAAAVRAPLAEFLNAHPEVADALRPAWERIEERWREAVRRDALSRARPHLVRRDPAREQ
jgi:hypothetical protein